MIAITGATGKTGSPTANLLLDKGTKIHVIGRSEEKLQPFAARGAEIAVGDQEDAPFLTKAFTGCDGVYLLLPPKMDAPDIRARYNRLGDSAISAISACGVKKVVLLSSFGAELESGTGPVVGLHDVEIKLRALPTIDLAILRPAAFMENMVRNVSLIKHQHINGSSAPADAPIAMIATRDIAAKAAELLANLSFQGKSIIDLFGDRLSYREATRLIGEAIGMPELPYVQFSDTDSVKAMMGSGMSRNMAELMVEMTAAVGKGLMHPTQIDPLRPNTATSFKVFAKEVFAPAFRMAA